jgi:hypothetical protein
MQQAPSSLTVAYQNGRWFTGSIFEPRTMYVRAGRFIEAVERPDSVVNLGGYVLLPFGEAHNHNLELIPSQPMRLDALLRRYMQNGVFYVQNPDNLPRTRGDLAARINRPEAPDVAFANGGITGPGGHPVEIAQRNLASGLWTEADGEGGFLYTVANAAALDSAWPKLLATRPDFVKIYLLYSSSPSVARRVTHVMPTRTAAFISLIVSATTRPTRRIPLRSFAD